MQQTRYFCPECRRQFAEPSCPLVPWSGTHCPVCGGQYIHAVTFTPAFPGGDYDPMAEKVLALVPEAPTMSVPLVLLASVDDYAAQMAAFLGEPL